MRPIPDRVWHATDAEPFDEFDRRKIGDWKFGFWFATDRAFADFFGKNKAECRLLIENPYTISTAAWNAIRERHARDGAWFAAWRRRLEAEGHDGLRVRPDVFRSSRGVEFKDPEVFAVFDAAKIEILAWNDAPRPRAP